MHFSFNRGVNQMRKRKTIRRGFALFVSLVMLFGMTFSGVPTFAGEEIAKASEAVEAVEPISQDHQKEIDQQLDVAENDSVNSCEQNLEEQNWKSRIWRSRIWKSRIWRSRIWKSRIWRSRIWKCRIWRSRIWKCRIWRSRIWKCRIWRSRIWKCRIWRSRIWKCKTGGSESESADSSPYFCRFTFRRIHLDQELE